MEAVRQRVFLPHGTTSQGPFFLYLGIAALLFAVLLLMSRLTLHELFSQPYSLGILAGLVIGKPIGILLAIGIPVALGWARLPTGLRWKHMIGMALLAAIGFMVSLFITMLAFTEAVWINNSKLMVLVSSVGAGLLGYIYLHRSLGKGEAQEEEAQPGKEQPE